MSRFTPIVAAALFLAVGRMAAQDVAVPEAKAKMRVAAVKLTPPRAVKKVDPEYPYVLLKSGIRGQVLIDFVVDATGHAINPYIIDSTAPNFDVPALDAIQKWVFEPGRANGKPVLAPMRVPVIFEPPGSGADFSDWGDAAPKTGGASMDTDRQMIGNIYIPKIRFVLTPVYPYGPAREGATGTAKVTVLVDPDGRPTTVKIEQASRPEFGRALAAAAYGFYFEPGLTDTGVSVAGSVGYDWKFAGVPAGGPDADLIALEKNHPEKIVSARGLDHPLKPVFRRAPILPAGLGDKGEKGIAKIEILIDEKGQVRLPRIVSTSDEAFGYAAVQAVSVWLFEPPTINGAPAVVRVIVPFNFGAAAATHRG